MNPFEYGYQCWEQVLADDSAVPSPSSLRRFHLVNYFRRLSTGDVIGFEYPSVTDLMNYPSKKNLPGPYQKTCWSPRVLSVVCYGTCAVIMRLDTVRSFRLRVWGCRSPK